MIDRIKIILGLLVGEALVIISASNLAYMTGKAASRTEMLGTMAEWVLVSNFGIVGLIIISGVIANVIVDR